MAKTRSQTPNPSSPKPATTTMSATLVYKTPSTSSKISFRSQKIRKLSSKVPSNKVSISNKPIDENPSKLSSVLLHISKPLTLQGEIDIALNHLRSSDTLLSTLIDSFSPPTFKSDRTPFLALARSILYQQLAIKAAKSIYTRFIDLCGGEALVFPDSVLSLSAQQLRQIGVSGRKASYLHDLANNYKNGSLSDSSILEMNDESLLNSLIMVKGIGVWSVHMFMLFSLHRPDVLPVGDLGVRKGVQVLYGLKELPKPLEMEQLCENWKPYRSVGSWYMWRLMEAKGVIPMPAGETTVVGS